MKIRISVHLNSKAEHKAMETEALTAVGAELLRAGRIPIGKEIPHTQKKKKNMWNTSKQALSALSRAI